MLFNQYIRDRIAYLRFLLVLGALLLTLANLRSRTFFPEGYDPFVYRFIIAGLILVVVVLSHYSKWVKTHLQLFVYIAAIIAAIWVHIMVYQNSLHPRFLLTVFLVYTSTSLIMAKRSHLLIYTTIFLATMSYVVLNAPDPQYPAENFLIQLGILFIFIFIAVGNFIEAMNSLSSSIENFKTLIDNAETAYCLLGVDGTLTMINEYGKTNWEKIIGRPLEIDTPLRDYIDEGEQTNFEGNFSKALKGHKVLLEKEVLISSELSVWMEVKYIPILNKSEKVTSVLFSARDISAKKRSEQKMNAKNLELEKINSELDKFVYRAAHDLRAPLSSVLGLINLSEKEKEMPLIRQYIEMMKASIDRLNKYISDVIDYSANSRLEIASLVINVEKIIHNALDDHLYMEGAKEMVNEVKVNGNGVFMSDPKRVEIILNNIVSNAIKYRDIEKDQNLLSIRADINSSSAKFVIEDNGIGIHESQKDKIFDFFYRGNEQSDGSGIGLYIVKEAVDRLGGDIAVESEQGIGSTFTINLPNQKSSE